LTSTLKETKDIGIRHIIIIN